MFSERGHSIVYFRNRTIDKKEFFQ